MRIRPCLRCAGRLGLLPLICLALRSVDAGSATWNLNPTSSDWNTAANWMPNTVPNGPADIASFGVSSQTSISFSAFTEVNSIIFLPGANAFTITSEMITLTISGAGIINNSGIMQNLHPQAGVGILVLNGIAVIGDQIRLTALPGAGEAIDFGGNSSAGNCEIVNSATPQGSHGIGWTIFRGHSSASGATITNQSGTDGGGATSFFDFSSAGEAVITSEGAELNLFGGAVVEFDDSAQAGNATLIATGGTNGGGGGAIKFTDMSDGGTAQVQLLGNATLSISNHKASPPVTIGSLAGEGTVFLGPRPLSIGSNNLSTTFDGVIQDRGTLTKIGTGTLTLTGSNTYNGATTVTSGILLVSNISGSGTGTGGVSINSGTLGGSGIIAGAVTVGTNSGTGALLAPSKRAKKPATLTIQSALTLNDDSTYIYQLNTKRAVSDQVIANGVVIDSGAKFSLRPSGNNALTQGQVFTVISNTSENPISGTFRNLSDGAIVNVSGNNLQASYSGGDGNDLTLTVVP